MASIIDDDNNGSNNNPSSSKKVTFFNNISKKVSKLGKKLNLVTLSSKKDNDDTKNDDIDITFDYPATDSFIGENPLANRDSEYRFSEYENQNYDDDNNEYDYDNDNDDNDDNDDDEYDDDDNEAEIDGNYEEEDQNLFEIDDDDELQSMLRLLQSLTEDDDDDDDNDDGNDNNNRITISLNKSANVEKVSEGIVKTGNHKHKLKLTNDLERINKNRCDICKETGGCIYYCDFLDDDIDEYCDFDMCYDCKRQEQGGPSTNRFSSVQQTPSVFDNRPCQSKTMKINGGHSDRINAVCLYIPPINYRKTLATILTASEDCTVCIWSLFSGDLVRKLENHHDGPITTIQLFQHPKDDSHVSVITGSKDRSIIIYDYNTGKVRKMLKGNKGPITGLAIHYRVVPLTAEVKEERVSIYIVSVDQNSKGYIFDYSTGLIKQNPDGTKRIINNEDEAHDEPITGVVLCHWKEEKEEKKGKRNVKISIDRTAIITVDQENKMAAWDLSAKLKFEFLTDKGCHEEGSTITSITALSGKTESDVRIVTAAEDSQIFVWSFKQKCALNRLMFGHKEGAINGLTFYDNRVANSKDIKMLSVGDDGALLIWDYYRAFRKEETGAAGQKMEAFKIPIYSPKSEEKVHPLTGVTVYVNPNNKEEVYVITTTDVGEVVIWELIEDESVKQKLAKIDQEMNAKKDVVPVNYYNKALEYIGLRQQDNLDSNNFLDFDVQDIVLGHRDYIRRLVHCAFDGTVITAADDRTAIQWNINNGRVKHKLQGHSSPIVGIAIIPKRQDKESSKEYEILTIDWDGLAIVWVNGKVSYNFLICNDVIHEIKEKIHGLHMYHSKNKNYILTVSTDLTCSVWDYETKKVVRKLVGGHDYALLSVTVHRFKEKDYIFTSSRDNTVAMWSLDDWTYDSKTGHNLCKVLCKFVGHEDEVNQVEAFSYTEGKEKKMAICTCSDDRACFIWKVSLSEEEVTQPYKKFENHTRGVNSIAIYQSSPSNSLKETYFVSVSSDEKTIVWNCESGFHFEFKNKVLHSDFIRRVIIVPSKNKDGKAENKVITASDDCTCIIWDLHDIKTDKAYTFSRQLGHVGSDSTVLKGLTLSLYQGEEVSKEIEITQDKSKKDSKKINDEDDDDDDEEEEDEDGVEQQKLKNLHIWRRGQYIIGFCFLSKEKTSKTYGHIYYIDLDLRKVNYYYKLEISDDIQDKTSWLRNQFYSLRFKALYYHCRFKDANKIERALKKYIEELSKYETNSKNVSNKINDHGFKELTSVPLIDTLGLKKLAKTYPIMFRDFICKLSLLDCTSVMFTTRKPLYPFPDVEYIESRSGYDVDGNFCWDDKDVKRVKDKYVGIFDNDPDESEVASFFVPLSHAGSIEMLESYVNCCHVLNDVSLFDNEVVKTGLKHAWRNYGIYAHLIQMGSYIVFITVLMISTYLFNYWSDSHPRVALGSQILVLALVFILISDEVLDVYTKAHQDDHHHDHHHHNEKIDKLGSSITKIKVINDVLHTVMDIKAIASLLLDHFSNAWNALDFIVLVLSTVGTVYRIVYSVDSMTSTSCLAVAILFAWIRSLYYLQSFRDTGPLIAMILHIIREITPFLGVLFMVLIGFTSAFFLLSQDDASLPFGTVKGAFLSSFDYMLGNFDSDFSGTSNPELATVLYVLYLLFALVVMFNLLIAIMSNAYTEVQTKGLSQWRYEQATILIELKRKLPFRYLNAVHHTYTKTTNRYYSWYHHNTTDKNNKMTWLSFNKKEDPIIGEGCWLYTLKRRIHYDATNSTDSITTKIIDDRIISFEDSTNKKISSIDDKITTIESKLDDIIKTLSSISKK